MKYKNDDERRYARRLSNRLAKQRSRANLSLKKDKLLAQPVISLGFDDLYIDAIAKSFEPYPVNYSLTLTNNKQVTGNMHNKSVEAIKAKMIVECSVTNYLKTNEYTVNYHAHIVFQSSIEMNELKDFFSKNWGSGFFRLKEIDTEEYRHNAIYYCLKQLKPTSDKAIMQFLIDTWDFAMLETFSDVKQAEITPSELYKAKTGITF